VAVVKPLRIDKGDHVEPVFTDGRESVLEVSKPDGERLYARVLKAVEGEPMPVGAQQIIWHDGEIVTETFDCPGGPAQVATKAYRDGYERVFNKRTASTLN
jgi:hypothetical protein